MGKMPCATIPKVSPRKSGRLLELVHTDVSEPLPVTSKGGSKYFISFIDDKSRWVILYPM